MKAQKRVTYTFGYWFTDDTTVKWRLYYTLAAAHRALYNLGAWFYGVAMTRVRTVVA